MKSRKNKAAKAAAFLALCVMLCSAAPAPTPASTNNAASTSSKPGKIVKMGMVSFKKCVEDSKLGKFEQANFESLKKQMESVLAEKEKTLSDMASKFNDADYLDSLSPEAETDLKRKFRALNQELSQQQNQYLQSLQQTNFQVVQKLQEQVTKAAELIAKNEKYDVILNDESTFFASPDLDISSKIIAILDQDFDKNPPQSKENARNTPENNLK